MAITTNHTIDTTLRKAIDYILNPDKTDAKLLVHAYACTPEIADIEFDCTREHAYNKGEHLARHIIQAFSPGETTPEQAHEIGKRFADELLGGKFVEAYCNIKNSEHEVVRRFYLVPRNKQKIILQTLENNVSLNNRDIVKNVRLFECTEMMYEMREKWKTWVPCEFIPADANMNYKKTELVKKFGEALKEPGTSPARLRDNLYEYIAYEEADWYLILLVRMMSIGDKPSGLYIKRMTSKGEKPSRMYPEEECIMNKTLMLLDYLDWGWGNRIITFYTLKSLFF